MKRKAFIVAGVLVGTGAALPRPLLAYTMIARSTMTATATVTGTNLLIAAVPLPGQAFFGKNLVIPVQVTAIPGPIDPKNLRVDIEYQLLNANGGLLSPPISAPISFVANPTNPNILNGSALIARADLSPIQHGGQLLYMFRARQNGSDTILNTLGIGQESSTSTALVDPFQTSIIEQLCQTVSPDGSRVSAPDLFEHDGQTSVALAQGAVTTPGTLCINAEDATGWPAGPGGSKAAAIYSITLQDTSLSGTAQVILSYPADISGKVLDLNADPESLGIYWLNQSALPQVNAEWLPLSRAIIDTTLHTVTGLSSHFSTFALFAAGALSNADLRPAQRIITPNGDGINDKAIFGTGIDEVRIFDVRGRRVKTISGPAPQWDGTDDDGKIVPSGVYLYQYTSQGERISGVIGVAK